MRVSELLQEGVKQFLELTPSIESHLTDTENPHHVTKEAVGLGNLSNALQATEADFSAHRKEAVLDHPDGSVTGAKLANGAVGEAALASGAVTQEKLAEGSVSAAHLAKQSVSAGHLASPVLNMIAAKVEQEAGKGLSQNDFTDALKNKLEAISVTNGEATVDLASLLTRTGPLNVRKTGLAFTESETSLLLENIAEVVSFDTYPKSKFASIGYMTTEGTYGCAFLKEGRVHCTFQGNGTQPGATSMLPGSISGYIAAELIDGVLQVYVSSTTTSTVPTMSLKYTVPISDAYGTMLKHIFLRPISSGHELTAVYFNNSHTRLVVDCFSIAGSNVTNKWHRLLTCDGSAYSRPQSALFTSWYTMAVMDYHGNLFLAPTDCNAEPYVLLRINADGEICDRFLPRSRHAPTEYSLARDLILDGDYLYYMTGADLFRIAVSTGVVTRLCAFVNSKYWDRRSITLLPDGTLCMYGVVANTGVGTLLLVRTDGEDIMATSRGDFLQFVPAATPVLCRNVGDISGEVEGLLLDTETGQLTSRRYASYTTYEVL